MSPSLYDSRTNVATVELSPMINGYSINNTEGGYATAYKAC